VKDFCFEMERWLVLKGKGKVACFEREGRGGHACAFPFALFGAPLSFRMPGDRKWRLKDVERGQRTSSTGKAGAAAEQQQQQLQLPVPAMTAF
jgi:hypothetical protein